METAFNGAIKVYNEIVGKINAGEIRTERGNICPICLGTGFKAESRLDRWGNAYWGVSKSYHCCGYWQRRAEQHIEYRKIDRK